MEEILIIISIVFIIVYYIIAYTDPEKPEFSDVGLPSVDIMLCMVPPGLTLCLGIGVQYAQGRLALRKITALKGRLINASGRMKVVLFDKTGRINSNSKSLEEGKLVNLIQNDSFKIGGFMHSITSLICLPVSIFVNLIYLFRFSLLNGTIILSVQCLTCFSVIWLSFQFKEVNKKLLYERDGRMKIINDSFQDITSMKLLGWEDEILKRV